MRMLRFLYRTLNVLLVGPWYDSLNNTLTLPPRDLLVYFNAGFGAFSSGFSLFLAGKAILSARFSGESAAIYRIATFLAFHIVAFRM